MTVLVDFEGHKPFQYRVLMPAVIKSIEYITPDPVKRNINNTIANFIEMDLKKVRTDIPDYKFAALLRQGYRTTLFITLNSLVLFLFLISLRKLAIEVNLMSKQLCDFLPLSMALVLPIFNDFCNFIYDFPHLLLFTLGLLFLYKKQWDKYLFIYILSLLNKESAVMLVIVFALNNYCSLPKVRFIKLMSTQVAIFIIIKLLLYFIFIDNPGNLFELHLKGNFIHLMTFTSYFNFEPLGKGMFFPFYLDIPLPRGLNLLMFTLICASVIYGWKEKPQFLRRATAYFIFTFILGMIAGNIHELRAYYDILPIVYLLGSSGVLKFTDKIKLKMIR